VAGDNKIETTMNGLSKYLEKNIWKIELKKREKILYRGRV
jgi:(p)ppGpp synthase/HD superfamily hydrolase